METLSRALLIAFVLLGLMACVGRTSDAESNVEVGDDPSAAAEPSAATEVRSHASVSAGPGMQTEIAPPAAGQMDAPAQ